MRHSSLFELENINNFNLKLTYDYHPEEKRKNFIPELSYSLLGSEAIISLFKHYASLIFLVHPFPIKNIKVAIHQIRLLANDNLQQRPDFFYFENPDYFIPDIVFNKYNFIGDNLLLANEKKNKDLFPTNIFIENNDLILYNKKANNLYQREYFQSQDKNYYGIKDFFSLEFKIIKS